MNGVVFVVVPLGPALWPGEALEAAKTVQEVLEPFQSYVVDDPREVERLTLYLGEKLNLTSGR